MVIGNVWGGIMVKANVWVVLWSQVFLGRCYGYR